MIVGNDPVVLSGTAFLAYMTRVAGIVPPTAWIFAQFSAANIGECDDCDETHAMSCYTWLTYQDRSINGPSVIQSDQPRPHWRLSNIFHDLHGERYTSIAHIRGPRSAVSPLEVRECQQVTEHQFIDKINLAVRRSRRQDHGDA